MPLLGPSDSFNSSGATIVPDRERREQVHEWAPRTFSTLLGTTSTYNLHPTDTSSSSNNHNLRSSKPSLDSDSMPSPIPTTSASSTTVTHQFSSQSTETGNGDTFATGTTIHTSATPTTQTNRSNGHGAPTAGMETRALGPTDSFQRTLDAILGPSARMGLLQNEARVGSDGGADGEPDFPGGDDGNPFGGFSGLIANFGNDPTTQVDVFNPFSLINDELQDNQPTSNHQGYPQPSLQMLNNTNPGTASPSMFRPSSSASHHSIHSEQSHHSDAFHMTTHGDAYRSDFSLSSTEVSDDIDTDDPDFDVGPSGDNNYDAGISVGRLAIGGGIGTVNPGAFGVNAAPPSSIFSSPTPWREETTVSPDANGGGTGQRRLTGQVGRPPKKRLSAPGEEDSEQKRVDRLEHRRSINRRSAQKHRLRRKEELEELNAMIAEKDKRIAELERELAATKAQLDQLTELVRNGLKVRN